MALFLAAFLGTVVVFWLLPVRFRFGFLAIASAVVVGLKEPLGVATLGIITLFAYQTATKQGWWGKSRWMPVLIIVVLLSHLFYFKYLPSLNILTPAALVDQAIPLGISYYTFKLIHFIVESRRGLWDDVSAPKFFCYIFLYPIFTAGPIERFDHFCENLQERFSIGCISEGGTRIVYGCIKKFVIANLIAHEIGSADLLREFSDFTSPVSASDIWVFALLTYLYVYFDFSAYSDLAIGSSRLFGIKIAENFNFPLISVHIVEFWQRWHITLRAWCQSYIYLPVIAETRKPYLAVFVTFIAMGLWHAGAINYLLWGIYHALGVVIFQQWRKSKLSGYLGEPQSTSRVLFGCIVTNLFISVSHILSVHSNIEWYSRIMVIYRMVNPFIG